jgi:hypothetical protein
MRFLSSWPYLPSVSYSAITTRARSVLAALFTIAAVIVPVSVVVADETDDLIKLAQSGVDEEVMIAFIDQSPDTFDMDADDFITLKDLGVSSQVIAQALRHNHNDTLAVSTDSVSSPTAPETTVVHSSQVVAPQQNNLNVSFFYEAMYPYGTWMLIDGTWCWQPNAAVMDGGWAPYCNHGHWVYTDWGWAWVSDYSWGWAPFHYGRWFRHHDRGWLWVPDTEWGPAWVSWRTNPDYFGWAPLPPRARYVRHEGFYFGATLASGDFEFGLTARDYFFIHARNFCDPDPWVHVVPPVRVHGFFSNTTVIKNNYTSIENKIVNQGPLVSAVSNVTNRIVVPIPIVADNILPGRPVHAGVVSGNRLIVLDRKSVV